ncbi:MAG: hypothetical protein AB2A00_06350 [Myxococcota bacterium]
MEHGSPPELDEDDALDAALEEDAPDDEDDEELEEEEDEDALDTLALVEVVVADELEAPPLDELVTPPDEVADDVEEEVVELAATKEEATPVEVVDEPEDDELSALELTPPEEELLETVAPDDELVLAAPVGRGRQTPSSQKFSGRHSLSPLHGSWGHQASKQPTRPSTITTTWSLRVRTGRPLSDE